MRIRCTWNEKMKFSAEAGENRVEMDANPPIGSGTALTPKQLLLAAISGCTGMDVVSLLRKYKQPLERCLVDAEAMTTDGSFPVVFKEVKLSYLFTGQMDVEKVLESVRLSQTKYCGVTAMLSQAIPISYEVELNGRKVGTGQADFKGASP